MNEYESPGFYNADCMDAMRQFPDGFFDLAIVDPPYGIGITGTPGGAIKQHSERTSEKIVGGVQRDSTMPGLAELNHSDRQTKVGGGLLCRPKAITPSTIKSHQMQSISLS